jgi:hypothetical protein
MKKRHDFFRSDTSVWFAVVLALTGTVLVQSAEAQVSSQVSSGTTEYFNHAEFKSKAGSLTVITFDDVKTGNGALKGKEYMGKGVRVIQRDGHPINVLRAQDNQYYHPTNFSSQPNGISSASGVDNRDWPERSDNFDFIFSNSVNAAGLWIGNLNGVTEIQFLSADQCAIAKQKVDEKHKHVIKGPSKDRWDNRIFYGITTSRRIERIRVINNANDGDGIVLDDIQFGLVPGKQPGESAPQGIRIFPPVPSQDSKAFKSAVHKSLRVVSPQNWDPIPYHMTQPFSTTINAKPGQRFFLAGDALGKIGWSLDNFLLVEIESRAGTDRLIIGNTNGSPVEYQGQRLRHIGAQSFSFSPESVDLSPYFPKDVPFRLTISALDFGGVGSLSNLFLVARDASGCLDTSAMRGATPKEAAAKSANGAADTALP